MRAPFRKSKELFLCSALSVDKLFVLKLIVHLKVFHRMGLVLEQSRGRGGRVGYRMDGSALHCVFASIL